MAFPAKWGNERMCSVSVIGCKDGIENEKCGKCENKGEAFLCGREAGFQ